jgi:DNA recombination protein RmuC
VENFNWILSPLAFVIGAVLGVFWARLKHTQSQALAEAEKRQLEERLISRNEKIAQLERDILLKETEFQGLQRKYEELLQNLAQHRTLLDKERELSAQRLKDFEAAKEQFSNSFKALASETLKQSNTSFLELAQTHFSQFHEIAKSDLEKRETSITNLLKPVQEFLNRFDSKIQDLEKARVGAYEGLSQQVRSLMELQTQLKSETNNLVRALSNPGVRGRWGETQLRRVIELSGMLNYCDFQEQVSVDSGDGKLLRPDVIVKLPQGKTLVIDAKAPLSAYLEAMELDEEIPRKERLMRHAKLMRSHISELSKKSYWAQFDDSLEFVLMFIPGDSFYQSALEVDADLIEYAFKNNVIPVTPASLISLLKAVAYGWRQEGLAQNAQKISELGKELYQRLGVMSSHFEGLGKNLTRAVESYNKTVSSLESRVLSSARKFKELSVDDSSAPLPESIEPIEVQTRQLRSEGEVPQIEE